MITTWSVSLCGLVNAACDLELFPLFCAVFPVQH
jgi:hypothetical protein